MLTKNYFPFKPPQNYTLCAELPNKTIVFWAQNHRFLLLIAILNIRFGSFCHCRGEDKVVQLLIIGLQNVIFRAFPPLLALVDIYNLLANLHHRVHIVSIDDGGNIVLLRNALDKVINDNRGLRVKARVRFVAEEISRIQHDSTSDSRTFNHTARQLRRVEVRCVRKFHTLQAELNSLALLLLALCSEEVEWQFDILVDGRRVDERSALENHSYILADSLTLCK